MRSNTPAVRSRMMSKIRANDTRPEMLVRRYLHASGLRFRLHQRFLPGSPDIVLRRFRTVIFVNGCFWHRHSGCRYATTPSTNQRFWETKFAANVSRDERNVRSLLDGGWTVIVIWECLLRRADRNLELDRIVSSIRFGAKGYLSFG